VKRWVIFRNFMPAAANRIATPSRATPGVEGYAFDGVDGSQTAFWKCHETAAAAAHVHDCDEHLLVVQGCYTLIIAGQRIALHAGDEYCIARRAACGRGSCAFGGRANGI